MSTGMARVRIETDGFTGEACQNATQALNAALGTVLSEELTPEYYATLSPQEISVDHR
jgi:hypothetical protein